MGPKPQAGPRPPGPATSLSAPASSSSSGQAKMGPPSNPVPNVRVLEPEINALQDSLKKTTVAAAQIFRFYHNTHRIGVQAFLPKPPRSLTSSLATELARYDQICDTLESKLNRAIAVLQRNLNREEARIKEEERKTLERAAAEKASQANETKDIEMQPAEVSGFKKPTLTLTPTGAVGGPGRRQSKISLSTLHRSQLPLKLDLSSSALRLSMDEAAGMGLTGLASPISIAPKSARPMGVDEFPPELLAAIAASTVSNQRVDIDLTMSDSSHPMDLSGMQSRTVSGDLGGSADKPIELDLDSMDLFGDVPDGSHQDVGNLFVASDNGASNGAESISSGNNMGDIFTALSGSDNQREADELIASLNAQHEGASNTASAPSPSSLLASLASSAQHNLITEGPQDLSEGGDISQAHVHSFDYNNVNMSTFDLNFDAKGEDIMAHFLGDNGNINSSSMQSSDTGGDSIPKPGATY